MQEENRDLAAQRSAIYQQKLRRYHSRRVRHRSFREGDLVLRLWQKKSQNLVPPWKGPFVISKALLNGAYYLLDMRKPEDKPKGKKRKRRDSSSSEDEYEDSKRPWNIAQLRPFYTYDFMFI